MYSTHLNPHAPVKHENARSQLTQSAPGQHMQKHVPAQERTARDAGRDHAAKSGARRKQAPHPEQSRSPTLRPHATLSSSFGTHGSGRIDCACRATPHAKASPPPRWPSARPDRPLLHMPALGTVVLAICAAMHDHPELQWHLRLQARPAHPRALTHAHAHRHQSV